MIEFVWGLIDRVGLVVPAILIVGIGFAVIYVQRWREDRQRDRHEDE